MIIKRVLIIFILQCFVRGVENKDDVHEFTSRLSKYSIVKPQVIHRWARSISGSQDSNEKHSDESVSYAVSINHRRHVLHLKRNRGFLHSNVLRSLHGASGSDNSSHPRRHVHCYYHGKVEGYNNSMLALSTCYGLRGVIVLENDTFGIEPVPKSSTNEHILYHLNDTQYKTATCGVVNEAGSSPSYKPFEPDQTLVSLLRRKRNLPETSYVELVLVVDNLRYRFKDKNATAVRDEMVELANLLDGYYKELNIRIILVGLEIFKDTNPFSVEGSAGDVLERFVKWRKSTLIPKIRHDIGQLIIGPPQDYGNILGMAYVGTVCSVASSGGINLYKSKDLASFSTVVAHEMGHNLGMNHDGDNCDCGGGNCIMAPSAGGSTKFSQCSETYFENLILRGGGGCLRNQPSPSDVIGTAECGNGRLDEGEDCDCGKPTECKNKCCNAATCTFTRGCACADGRCCENCQIKVAGWPCRKSVDSCDLPEYCDGKKAFCPTDFYMMDGLLCQNNAAYCYEGRCQTYDYQCRHLFAPDNARQAEDICFKTANTKGDKFGNCGPEPGGSGYLKCSVANSMCGKVQCTNVDVNTPPTGAQVSIQQIQGATCVNADFNLGTDVLDPAYVNPGSPCDTGKTCVDFKCVNASVLLPDLDCDAKTTCNGHGVCNDRGHCHCDNGWGPPFCDKSGWGGSIDSGPAQIDYSLRNGLLIFFFLVVPLLVLLILVLLYIFKRDSLDVCLKRSRNTGNRNTNVQPKNNVQAGVTAPTPQAPPERPTNPPSTAAPISGFRYGELDYWRHETNNPPPRPPPPGGRPPQPSPPGGRPPRPSPPVQGPGVSKPIPSNQIA
uniref:Zgc:174164 n=1 Tax=Oryzias latipes TaxID=8090 RepID=A0A3P9LVE5_ORYLA